jgi:hypothetical protein
MQNVDDLHGNITMNTIVENRDGDRVGNVIPRRRISSVVPDDKLCMTETDLFVCQSRSLFE